ncbi:hypothetical protein [Halarchaeum grantii]|nr:hypothetical protein [Halarchaeum grantii]
MHVAQGEIFAPVLDHIEAGDAKVSEKTTGPEQHAPFGGISSP